MYRQCTRGNTNFDLRQQHQVWRLSICCDILLETKTRHYHIVIFRTARSRAFSLTKNLCQKSAQVMVPWTENLPAGLSWLDSSWSSRLMTLESLELRESICSCCRAIVAVSWLVMAELSSPAPDPFIPTAAEPTKWHQLWLESSLW